MTRFLQALLLCFLCSCNSTPKLDIHKTHTLDLLAVRELGILDETQEVTVKDDPVYHKTKKYNSVALLPLLKQFTPIDSIDIENHKVVFECEDGYKPEMSLQLLLEADAYVATSDAEASPNKSWEQVIKDGVEMKTAPFYVVYKGVSAKDYTYKWPYNLVKIHLEPKEVAEIPPATEHTEGRCLYIQHCKVCHALNGAGGNMGPELNQPMSVTAYWKENHLIAFIQNPQAYRTGVKMPNLGIAEEESIQIVAYLTEVSNTN